MPETPTPGQVNFVAWQCDITGCGTDDAVDMWPLLGRVEQRAWEAAAQAVLAQYKDQLAQAWLEGQAVRAIKEEEERHE